jgi:putative transposase
MPRRGRTQLRDQHVFFVTFTVKEFEPVFLLPDIGESIRELLFEVIEQHSAVLFGYVIMPNHIHLLVAVETGGPGLSRLVRDIKSLSWRRFFRTRPGIWMARFDDLAIVSEKQFRIKLEYIHRNPVRAGLVGVPDAFPYSSAAAWAEGKPDSHICTTLDFEWPSGRDA